MMHRLTFCCGTRINYCFSSSESSTSAATNAASDNADIVQGGAVTKAGDFSDVQSGNSNRNEGDGTILSLEGGSKLNLGNDFSGANVHDVNIETADPELVAKALEEVTRLSNNFSGTVAGLNADVLDKITELSLSKQTDGETERNKTILYIALAGLAVLGLWTWRQT
jgi:hypothetical protein